MQMKAMGTVVVNNQTLEVGRQNFRTETVDVQVNNKTITCKMVSDVHGDLGFLYNDQFVYFSEITC